MFEAVLTYPWSERAKALRVAEWRLILIVVCSVFVVGGILLLEMRASTAAPFCFVTM